MFPTNLLLDWYRKEKRDLPWRETRNPYLIWLSEIILQQTRVEQGLSYFLHFAEKYPTVDALAAADEQEVLRSWQGLGYYSRARNLHAAAKSVVQEGRGFPATHDEILTLKGVGPYTAAAIASFAYKEVVPVVDGNVNRVISRFLALGEAVDSAAGAKAIKALLDKAISQEEPDTFNQAIMELGALVCSPRKPDCSSCPISGGCIARKHSTQEDFPIKKSKTKVRHRWLYVLLVANAEHVILRKRGADGIWKNMFDLPAIESDKPLSPEELTQAISSAWPDLDHSGYRHFLTTTHLLSHRKFHVEAFGIHSAQKEFTIPGALHRVSWKDLDSYPIPRLTEKLLENWREVRR